MRLVKPFMEYYGEGYGGELKHEPKLAMKDYSDKLLRHIEGAGRCCYKSENLSDGQETTESFIRGIIRSGHGSVLEHVSLSFRVGCDRGISHQIVRHRHCAYSQRSTRYCNYAKKKFGNQVTYVIPPWLPNLLPGEYFLDNDGQLVFPIEMIAKDNSLTPDDVEFIEGMLENERRYMRAINERGQKPDQARGYLNNANYTELIWTANLREWRHILWTRLNPKVHIQFREIMAIALRKLYDLVPVAFEDIWNKYENKPQGGFVPGNGDEKTKRFSELVRHRPIKEKFNPEYIEPSPNQLPIDRSIITDSLKVNRPVSEDEKFRQRELLDRQRAYFQRRKGFGNERKDQPIIHAVENYGNDIPSEPDEEDGWENNDGIWKKKLFPPPDAPAIPRFIPGSKEDMANQTLSRQEPIKPKQVSEDGE